MLCSCFVENTAYNNTVKIQEFTKTKYMRQRNKETRFSSEEFSSTLVLKGFHVRGAGFIQLI